MVLWQQAKEQQKRRLLVWPKDILAVMDTQSYIQREGIMKCPSTRTPEGESSFLRHQLRSGRLDCLGVHLLAHQLPHQPNDDQLFVIRKERRILTKGSNHCSSRIIYGPRSDRWPQHRPLENNLQPEASPEPRHLGYLPRSRVVPTPGVYGGSYAVLLPLTSWVILSVSGEPTDWSLQLLPYLVTTVTACRLHIIHINHQVA